MDDARIRRLAEEVMAELRAAPRPEATDLEARVAALEAALGHLQGSVPAAAATVVVAQATAPQPAHPAFGLLGPSSGGQGQCVLEPGKPCVGSGQCRSFGH